MQSPTPVLTPSVVTSSGSRLSWRELNETWRSTLDPASEPEKDRVNQSLTSSNGSNTFNGPLHALKAFGIATAAVVLGGATAVVCVMRALGVHDVRTAQLRECMTSVLPTSLHETDRGICC
jgi:hypothetical protein